MHILTGNRAAAALLMDFGTLPPHERDCIRPIFLHEDFRNLSSTGRRPHASASPYCAETLDHPIAGRSHRRRPAPAGRHRPRPVHGHPAGTRHRVPRRPPLPPAVVLPGRPAGTGPHGARGAARAASDGSLCFALCPGAVGRFRRW
ncbi:hypothetical protein AB0N26_18900 [Streptomyces cellulosae]